MSDQTPDHTTDHTDDGTDDGTHEGTDEGTGQPGGPALTLLKYPEKLAIVRLGPGAELPQWAESAPLFSITATATETSLVCATRSVPTKTPSIKPLTAFQVRGPLDPDAIGILAGLLVPLAEAEIPVYTLSTFDTDWVMVRLVDAGKAAEAWRRRGHTVTDAVPAKPARDKGRDRPRRERGGADASPRKAKK
jgi:uncharacterized protein